MQTVIAGLVPSFLGAVAYAIVRGGYVWFYEPYGIAPEEVGLSNLDMLSSIFRPIRVGLFRLPTSPFTNLLLASLSAGLLVAFWRWLLPLLRLKSRQVDVMATHHPILLGFSVVIILVMLLYIWVLPHDIDLAGKRLQQGKAIRPSELAILFVEANPAHVVWIGEPPSPLQMLTTDLVYLGKSDGILVFYQPPDWRSCPARDVCRRTTWKVQEGNVILRLIVNPPDRHAPRLALGAVLS